MAKTIRVDVSDDVYDAIALHFPDKGDDMSVVRAVARLALTEWAEWFEAENRPRTISALHQARVRRVYQDPDLYKGRKVQRGTLFNQWNIPYGEASYVERVFAETELPDLIAAALDTILTELNQPLTDWGKSKDKDPDQQFSVEVDKYGQQVLQSIMQAAKEEEIEIAPTERSSAVHGYYTYTFVVTEAEMVKARCEQLRKKYPP